MKKKRLLIVDDSPTLRQVLQYIFADDPEIEVIACAESGKQAIELVNKLLPDVITMDICMPNMDGIEAINRIMATHATPIVVISSHINDLALNATFRALEAGALSVLEKPSNILSPDSAREKKFIIDTVKSMADIKVFKRRFAAKSSLAKLAPFDRKLINKIDIIGIGASVGGPQALKNILVNLPSNFPVPITVVQHMTPGFINDFVAWLSNYTKIKLKVAEHAEKLLPGHVYFAPDNFHLMVSKKNMQLVANLSKMDELGGFRPSVSVLFTSIANSNGDRGMGILLTGMGRDGAEGLLDIKKKSGHTIIQDEKSSIVYGMPAVALSLGAVDRIIELEKMSSYLIQLFMKQL